MAKPWHLQRLFKDALECMVESGERARKGPKGR